MNTNITTDETNVSNQTDRRHGSRCSARSLMPTDNNASPKVSFIPFILDYPQIHKVPQRIPKQHCLQHLQSNTTLTSKVHSAPSRLISPTTKATSTYMYMLTRESSMMIPPQMLHQSEKITLYSRW